jgi:large subunit ribosomal protein L3
MIEGLIGKKIGMTQTFDEHGNMAPITVIKVGPCTVIQKKTTKKDGYSALQVGFVEEKSPKKATKPVVGHYEKSGSPPMKILREFQFAEKGEVKEGDQFFVDIFQVGEKVHVVGTSKGKGFAGVIKRWGFHGGKATHGSMFHRSPGSTGAAAYPSRVMKGKKLPGHMGSGRVTVKNLMVIQADKENNLLVVRGAVPGAKGGYLLIKKANFDPALMPEQIKVEQPVPEKSKHEEPKPEKRKPEEPKADQVEAKEPEAEKLVSKEAKPEKPEPEKPSLKPAPEKVEEPKAEEPEAEKPDLKEPEKPAAEQPKEPEPEKTEAEEAKKTAPEKADEPKAEEPEAEEPEKPEKSEKAEPESSQPEPSKEKKKE